MALLMAATLPLQAASSAPQQLAAACCVPVRLVQPPEPMAQCPPWALAAHPQAAKAICCVARRIDRHMWEQVRPPARAASVCVLVGQVHWRRAALPELSLSPTSRPPRPQPRQLSVALLQQRPAEVVRLPTGHLVAPVY